MHRPACAFLVVLACTGAGGGKQRVFPVLPPEATEPAIHEIHPGVLRSLMMAGELKVTPDEATLAAMTEAETKVVEAMVSVCLDVEGVPTTSLAARSRFQAFNDAVFAAVATWRFRPYVRDGRAAEACSTAVFRYHADTGTADDALPPRALELPPADIGVWSFTNDVVLVPPTPGVALAQVCRRPRRREPPDVTFLQSSGDPATDRALLDEREVMFNDAGQFETICRMRSMIRRVPEPPEIRKKPVVERDVPPQAFEELRLSGTVDIVPAEKIKARMLKEHVGRIELPVKVCIDRTGRVREVEALGASRYTEWDADVINAVAAWTFTPMMLGDAPIRACTLIQFIYRQKR